MRSSSVCAAEIQKRTLAGKKKEIFSSQRPSTLDVTRLEPHLIYTYICTYIYTYIHSIYIHTYIHIHSLHTHRHIHTHTHTHTHTPGLDERRRGETYNHHRCVEILKSQYTGYLHVVRKRTLTYT